MMMTIARSLIGLATVIAVLGSTAADAEVRTKEIQYKDGNVVLTGVLAWDDAAAGKRPGVLVVHEWWGLNAHARNNAKQLAKDGYVAFAVDMYGDNKVTTDPKNAKAWMTAVTSDKSVWKRRFQLGLDTLTSQPGVAADKIAAAGYCFGGTTVMQMAYAGADLKAVVSFHGSLPPAPESVTSIRPRVLIAHGRDDAFIPRDRVIAFQDGLDRINADWEMTVYSDTRHSFTNPEASSYGVDNIAYNETAAKRSWAAMLKLFSEIF